MGAYGTLESGFAGLKAEQGDAQKVESWVANIEDMNFGDFAFANQGDESIVQKFKLDTAKLVLSADLVTLNKFNVTVNGANMAEVTFATDHATTMTAIVTALKAMTGVEASLDSTDTNNRTIWIRTKNATCTITNAAVTAGASQATITTTTTSTQIFVGVVMFTQKAIYAYNSGKYSQYEQVPVLAKGVIWVNAREAVKANDEAYIYNVAGSDFAKAANSGILLNARFRSTTTAAGIAKVEVYEQCRPVTSPFN